jgi:hypothetical protein
VTICMTWADGMLELAPSCLGTSRGPAPVGGNKIMNATQSAYIINATSRFVMGSISEMRLSFRCSIGLSVEGTYRPKGL